LTIVNIKPDNPQQQKVLEALIRLAAQVRQPLPSAASTILESAADQTPRDLCCIPNVSTCHAVISREFCPNFPQQVPQRSQA
jgi:hypothetical protein